MYPVGHDILIVDDNPARRDAISICLEREGFSVTAVAEGLAAIRIAQRHRFALVVAASALPGSLDGAATLSQLRARQPWVKVLFIGDVSRRPRRPGADGEDFISVPFQKRELIGCVFELLQREIVPGGELLRRSRLELGVQ